MKTAKISFEVVDDFKEGDCVECPLHSIEGDDYYGEEYRSCQLGYPFSECPIEFAPLANLENFNSELKKIFSEPELEKMNKGKSIINQLIEDIRDNDWYCIQYWGESNLHEWEKALLVAGLESLLGGESDEKRIDSGSVQTKRDV